MPVKSVGKLAESDQQQAIAFPPIRPTRDCGRSGGPHIIVRLSFHSEGCSGQVFRLEYYPNCQRCRLLVRYAARV